jgi:protocatechuate 4,5-dioxygenase beta chain
MACTEKPPRVETYYETKRMRASGSAILSYRDESRVAILGTGGLSHGLTGERTGFINENWDRRWLDCMEGDPRPLTRLTRRPV